MGKENINVEKEKGKKRRHEKRVRVWKAYLGRQALNDCQEGPEREKDKDGRDSQAQRIHFAFLPRFHPSALGFLC